jgi:hypothetical protein
LLCGSESWTVSQAHGALVEGSERKILRRIYEAIQTDGVWQICYIIKSYIVYLMMLT